MFTKVGDTENIAKVKVLNSDEHSECVKELDKISGNNVMFWLDTDMAFGIFEDDELKGYLTLGYADDCSDVIESHPKYHSDARILSNVYVKWQERNKGYATQLMFGAFKEVSEVTFLMLLDERLIELYKRLDFKLIDELTMIRDL